VSSAFHRLEDVILDDLFPEVDLSLRQGRHVGREDDGAYTFLVDALDHLEGVRQSIRDRTADLAAMVRHIMEGGTVRPSTSSAAALPQTDLTAREQEVLCLAARGHSNAAIADELFVTAQTVKFHLSNAYRKLGVHNRTEAAHRAARMGVCG
jgi:DNA-binding NarL/FixJ family response regulator